MLLEAFLQWVIPEKPNWGGEPEGVEVIFFWKTLEFPTLPLEIFTISFFTTIFSPLENLQSCVIVCHPLEILR